MLQRGKSSRVGRIRKNNSSVRAGLRTYPVQFFNVSAALTDCIISWCIICAGFTDSLAKFSTVPAGTVHFLKESITVSAGLQDSPSESVPVPAGPAHSEAESVIVRAQIPYSPPESIIVPGGKTYSPAEAAKRSLQGSQVPAAGSIGVPAGVDRISRRFHHRLCGDIRFPARIRDSPCGAERFPEILAYPLMEEHLKF
jgi:hypothetical protein